MRRSALRQRAARERGGEGRMTGKIFRAIFFSAMAVLLISIVMISGLLYGYTTELSERQLRTEAELAAHGLERQGQAYLEGLPQGNLRITWIGGDGTVLYDNASPDAAALENHLEREEVQQALRTGYGESRRYSETLMGRLLYAAVRLEDGSVLRLSVSQRSIWMLLLGILQPLLVVTVLAAGLSAFFSVRLSERIIRPLNFLDLEQPLDNAGFDELAPLLRRISSQQEELTRQERFLDQKQEELDTILEHMEEGLLLLDENGKLVRMNAAACEMLDIREEPAGKTLLTLCRQMEVVKLAEQALRGERGEACLALRRKSCRVGASPIRQGEEIKGAVLVFMLMADAAQQEKDGSAQAAPPAPARRGGDPHRS